MNLIDLILQVNPLQFISNDYKITKEESMGAMKKFEKAFNVEISAEIKDFICFVNGKMFDDWVLIYSNSTIPVFRKKTEGDFGLFYSLVSDTQYDLFGIQQSAKNILDSDIVFAESTPGDHLAISLETRTYGKVYFISHDVNEDEQPRYLVSESLQEFVRGMHVKADE